MKLIDSLCKKFDSAVDHPVWKAWRAHAIRDFEFKEGKQWTRKETADLKDRGQPDTVENQIKVVVDRLTGKYRKSKMRIAYRGRNLVDNAVNDALTDIALYIRQRNDYEYEEGDMFDDGITSGFGVVEMFCEYDESFNKEIGLEARDCFNIFPDPESKKYDWNKDATFIAHAPWTDLEEAAAKWPKKKKQLEGLINYDPVADEASSFKKENYVDDKRSRVRIVELWYKKREILKKRFTENGVKDVGPGPVANIVVEKMYVGVFCGDVLLDHYESPHKHTMFPFVPFFCFRKKDGEPYSPVRMIIDPQMEINKRRSKALHLLTTNQAIYERGAVSDKDQLAAEMARPDGQVEIEHGFMDKFKIEKNIDLAATQMSFHNESKLAIRDITGINPESGGPGHSEVRSGIGIARKQGVTDEIVLPIFDNLKRTRKVLARLKERFIRQYYTEERVFNITDDLKKTKVIELTAPYIEQIQDSGFDTIIDDLPDTLTTQAEQLEIISQSLPQLISAGPGWARLLVQMSDIRDKEAVMEIIDRIDQPQPLLPKVSLSLDWNELEPEEKAAFSQLMGAESLVEFELAEGRKSKTEIKAEIDYTKLTAKEESEDENRALDAQKTVFTMLNERDKNTAQENS